MMQRTCLSSMETLLGFVALYCWVHTFVLFTKSWKERNTYEQIVSIFGIVFFVAFILGTI